MSYFTSKGPPAPGPRGPLSGCLGDSPDGPKPDTTQALQDARPILGWFTDFFTKPAETSPAPRDTDGGVVIYPPVPAPAARELDTKKIAIGVALFGGALLLTRAALKGRR